VESARRKYVRCEVSVGETGLQARPAIIEVKQVKEYNFRCSACGGDRECDCSAPAIPKTQRAIEAIKADPDRSDRAIAKDIGVSQPTVSKARKEVAATDKQLSVEARTGLDGKTRKMPEKKAATNKTPEPTPQTQPIIVNLSYHAETLARVIFETCGAAKADAVAKELNKLITAAGNGVSIDASAETMKAKYDEALSEDDLSIPACLRRVS
jgi:hypothetical protein